MEFYNEEEMQKAVIENTKNPDELRYLLKVLGKQENQYDFALQIVDRILDRIEKR